MTDGVALASDGGPRWRVRVSPARGWRRWTDRRLAQAEVAAPGGDLYTVRIKRNWPIVRSPLGPFDSIIPSQISLGALLAANAVSRGRTGWSVEVVRPPAAWRSERVVHVRRSRDPERVLDLAFTIVDAISAGRDPADLDDDVPFGDRVKRAMNWD